MAILGTCVSLMRLLADRMPELHGGVATWRHIIGDHNRIVLGMLSYAVQTYRYSES